MTNIAPSVIKSENNRVCLFYFIVMDNMSNAIPV